jgi:predicted kinase
MIDAHSRPAFHLVCGSTGAGKTTYATDLAGAAGGVHFAIDPWMVTLFGPDRPDPMRFDWIKPRVDRCEVQIAAIARQCIQRGVSAVLDLGFTTPAHRRKFADLAHTDNIPVILHLLDVPADVRWARVSARNAAQGATYALQVNRSMFDFMEGMWEIPSPAEFAALNGRRV